MRTWLLGPFLRPLLGLSLLMLSYSPNGFSQSEDKRESPPSRPLEFETIFNIPGFQDQEDHAIENKLKELIRSAVPGSSIHVAIYSFSHRDIAQELLDANARGVNVEIIMDGKNKKHTHKRDHAVRMLTTTPEGKPSLQCLSPPCVRFCSSLFGSGCQGLHINHNKFFLFSHLKNGSKEVVVQTSYNLNTSQNRNYNDLIIIKNDSRLYKGFLQYWLDLKKDRSNLHGLPSIHGQEGTKAYLFPRPLGGDPVLRILNTVSCNPKGSMIRVLQSRFDRFRASIAKRLANLREQGCDVKVIVRQEPDKTSPGAPIRSLLGTDLMILKYKDSRGRALAKNSIHSKLILIDASIKGSPEKRPLVLTGSHNLNITSLRTNDEVLLALPHAEVYENYLHYWNTLLKDAQRSEASTHSEIPLSP